MTEGKKSSNDDLQAMEVINSTEFRPGCIVEITTKMAERIVVRRYYVSEDYNWLDDEIAEFPTNHRRNKKNIIDFLKSAKELIRRDYGEKEPIYIDKAALEYLKKVM